MRSIKYNRVELFRISLNNSFSFKEFPKKTGYWIKKKIIQQVVRQKEAYNQYITKQYNIL